MRPVPDRDKRMRAQTTAFRQGRILGLGPTGAQKQPLKRASQSGIGGQRHAGNEGAGIRQVEIGK